MMLFTSIKPMLLSIGNEPFDHDDYIFEPKWDGWRILLHKQGERIEAYTRNGNNVTAKFPELQAARSAIRIHTGIFDCEGIVLKEGRPVFDDFSYRGRISTSARIQAARITHPATFVVFDVLYSDRDHFNEPLLERKQRVREWIEETSCITPTLYLDGQGKSLFEMMRQRNMEGIVAKRKLSRYYLNTKSPDWLKIKYFKSIDVMILGYRVAPFALVIGLNFRTVKNKPVGVVEFGFKREDKQLFLSLAEPLHSYKDNTTQWMEPHLCCRIDYLERTDTHHLRTTIFRGFLLDKQPADCIWTY